MVLGLQAVVFSNYSVISFVLMGAYFHTTFITSYSASEICGRAAQVKNFISDSKEDSFSKRYLL